MKKSLLTVLGLAGVLVSAHAAPPVTLLNYSTGATNVTGTTGYFSTSDGWSNNTYWTNQAGGLPATPAWTASGDVFNSTIENISGFSPSGGNSGTLGAYDTTAVSVARSGIIPMSTALFTNISTTFTTEFALPTFSLGVLNDDTFAFGLFNSLNQPIVNFVLADNGAAAGDYSVLDANGQGYTELYSGFVYRLQVNVLPNNTWNATLYDVANPSTTRNITVNATGATGTTGAGGSGQNLSSLQASFTPGAVNGDVYFLANEFTITSTGDPIPEPSTWAVGALLLGGAVATIYRRRKLRTAQSAA